MVNGNTQTTQHVTTADAIHVAIDTVIRDDLKQLTIAELEHEMLRLDFQAEMRKCFKMTREGRLILGVFDDIELTAYEDGRIAFSFNSGACGGFVEAPGPHAALLQRLRDELEAQARLIAETRTPVKMKRALLRRALKKDRRAAKVIARTLHDVWLRVRSG